MRRIILSFLVRSDRRLDDGLVLLPGHQAASSQNQRIYFKNGLRVVMHQDISTPIVIGECFLPCRLKERVARQDRICPSFEHMMFRVRRIMEPII